HRRHPPPTLFPYTTLFRSLAAGHLRERHDGAQVRLFTDPQRREEERCGLRQRVRQSPAEGQRLRRPAEHSRRKGPAVLLRVSAIDRKSTRLNSSHVAISYA